MLLPFSRRIESLLCQLHIGCYCCLAWIAATVRQWVFEKLKISLKNGAGEGIRTLDFHLGKISTNSLSQIDRDNFLLLNKEITSFFGSLPYNRFYPLLTVTAATVRQWKKNIQHYGNRGEDQCRK